MRIDRLKALMAREGHTQTSLAKAIGVTQGAISQLMKGDVKRTRYLPEIARVLSTSVEYLLGLSDDDGPPDDQDGFLPSEITDAVAQSLNLLKVEDVSGAEGRRVVGEGRVRYLPADVVAFDPAAEWAVLTVEDNSMAPTLAAGDTVLVDRNVRRFVDDGIYALRVGDRVILRRVIEATLGDSVLVKADDPLYPAEPMTRDQLNIYGRARWTGRRLP